MARTSRFALATFAGAVLLAVGFLAGRSGRSRPSSSPHARPAAGDARPARRVLYWYDPMKPEVHFDHPGKSPFMDMELLPKYAEEEPAAPAAPAGYSVVRMPLERRQEIGVTTAKVERRTIGASVETNGAVAEDEGRVRAVNAKFSGYIERLFVDRTGQPVRKGQPLFSVYSPDLVATEREYLLALENARRLSGSASADAAADAKSLLASTRDRLRLWDVPEAEIRRIERSDAVSKDLVFLSPASGVVLKKDAVAGVAISAGMPLFTIADLSSVWVLADVYQSETGTVAAGDAAEVRLSFLPGEVFRGRVDFVYPTVAEDTRTIKVRIVIANPKGELKPGMLAAVALAGRAREVLAVPRSALIATGERQIVFVELAPGVFAPREVRTGTAGKDFVEAASGLSEGEAVVTSANFLIDSESRIGALGSVPAGTAGQPVQSIGGKPDTPPPPKGPEK